MARIVTLGKFRELTADLGDHYLLDVFASKDGGSLGMFTIVEVKPCRDMQMGLDSVIIDVRPTPAGPIRDED